ncbi:MAG: SurA N-terminal domain-containing protein [Nitrococcus sp.]|nr:SurA N-terminal domain-containing protein [Nitrococcus sp.]
MLQTIRDRAKGIVAYVIVGLLIIPFALFGVYNYFTGGSNPPVATVNGVDITRTELDNAVQRQQAQLRELLGDRYDPALFDEERLRRQVLDRMVDQAVLLHFVRGQGLRITDDALRSIIRSQPFFLVDGRFSGERYRTLLQQNGYSTEQYEAQLRQEQLLRQLQFAIAATSVITQHDVAQFVALERQRRNLAWLRIDSARLRDQTRVDKKAIQHYYDSHKQALRHPAQVKISYIELSENTLATRIEPNDKALHRYYEEYKDSRFTLPSARGVRHILIKLPQGASKEQVTAARTQIEALREQIVQGEDFAQIARRHSQDLGSARRGGEIGFVRRGETVEAVDEAVFKLQVGEISKPIRSRFGWHLIEVTAIHAGGVKPFAEVKAKIRQELLGQQEAKHYYELSNQVANYAYEHPDGLKPVADKYGLKTQQSGWFSRAGAEGGIGAYPQVVEAAFSDEVLKQGLNSQSIELDDGRQIILRVDHRKPASVPALEEVQDQIRDTLIALNAAQQAQALGSELLEKAKSGRSLESLAEGKDMRYSAVGWVQRDSKKVPATIIEQGFRLPHPSADKQPRAGVELPDGDYVVLELRGVRAGELSKLDDAERKRVREALQRLQSERTLQAMIELLRQRADVTLDRKLVARNEP